MNVYNNSCISKFTLRDKDDLKIVDGEEYFPGHPVLTQEISSKEAIIGLYGTKDKQIIRSIGFILVDTSPFANQKN